MTIARQLHRYTATQRRTYTDRHTYTDTDQHITPTQQTEDPQRDTADRHVFVCVRVWVWVCVCVGMGERESYLSRMVTFMNMVISQVKIGSPDMILTTFNGKCHEKKDEIPPAAHRPPYTFIYPILGI